MARLNFDIVLNDLLSSKLSKIKNKFDGFKNPFQVNVEKNSLNWFESKIDELRSKLKMSVDVKVSKSIYKELRDIEIQKENLENNIGIKSKGAKESGFGRLINYGLLIGSGSFIKDQIGDVAQVTGKYEAFGATMKNSFQSNSMATQSMDDLTKFAADTPFQVDNLTNSFIQLSNRGFIPTMKEMTSMGDLTANQGKSFDQLSEAILDASTGEFERLKEFGIKGSIQGNKAILNSKAGTKIIDKNDSRGIYDYIVSLGNAKGVQGSMAAVSKTTAGAISNMGDAFDQLKYSIGAATNGAIKNAIVGFTGIVNKVKDWFAVPLTEKLSAEKSEINALAAVLSDTTNSYEIRNNALMQLQTTYPEYFSNLNMENLKLEDLKTTLDKVNASYEKKIDLSAAKERQLAHKEDYDKLNADLAKKTKAKQLIDHYIETGDEGDLAALKKDSDWRQSISLWTNKKLGMFDLKDKKRARQQLESIYLNDSDQANYNYTEDVNKTKNKINNLSGTLSSDNREVTVKNYAAYLEDMKNYDESKLSEAQKTKFSGLRDTYEMRLNRGNETLTKVNPFIDENFNSDQWNYVSDAKSKLDEFFASLKKGSSGNNFSSSASNKMKDSGINGLTGTTGVKHITLNITKMVGLEIDSMQNTEMAKEKTGEEMLDIVLRAINSVN